MDRLKPLDSQLAHLETSGLIAIATLLPELEYLFRHALVQDAAYDSLLRKDRRELHRAVGEALEAAYPDKLDDLSPTLAAHFREADQPAKAIDYYRRAGERAVTRYANLEAEMHYRAGLELASQPADRARLLSGLGEALFGQSRMYEAIHAWSEGIGLYRKVGVLNHAALLHAKSARASWWAGDPRGALDLCQHGLSFVPTDLESKGVAALLHEAARSSYFNGQPDAALQYCRRALAMAERLDDASVQAEALITQALLLGGAEAIDSLERAISIAEAHGLLAAAGRAHHNLGTTLMFQRTPQEGLLHVYRAAEIAEQRGVVADQLYALSMILATVAASGRTSEMWEVRRKAESLLNQVERGSTAGQSMRAHIGAALFHVGEFDEARRIYRECCDMARLSRDEYGLASDCNQLAEIELIEGNYWEARSYIDEALALSEIDAIETVMTHYLALKLKLHEGNWPVARTHLQKIETVANESPNFRIWQYRELARVHIAASEQRWQDAEHLMESVIEALTKRGTLAVRNRRLLDWAEILYQGDPVGHRERVIEILKQAKAEYEAMQAPAYIQRIDTWLNKISNSLTT